MQVSWCGNEAMRDPLGSRNAMLKAAPKADCMPRQTRRETGTHLTAVGRVVEGCCMAMCSAAERHSPCLSLCLFPCPCQGPGKSQHLKTCNGPTECGAQCGTGQAWLSPFVQVPSPRPRHNPGPSPSHGGPPVGFVDPTVLQWPEALEGGGRGWSRRPGGEGSRVPRHTYFKMIAASG